MTYKEFLKYPLKITENKYTQKVIIYSMASLFVLVSISQNINLLFPYLFEPIITGCYDLEIHHTSFQIAYEIIKMLTYDILIISTFAWFLHKYKFCAFTLTSFYAVAITRITYSILLISGVNGFPLNLTATLILNFAWLTYIIHIIKSNRSK